MPIHLCVDVGGTFTDLFAIDDLTGRVIAEKVDSTGDAVTGITMAIEKSGIDPRSIATFVFGSTRATNALVEDRIERVAFFATEGFSDTLEIRRLWREHLFGWKWVRPLALVPRDLRFGVPGRIDWRGNEIEPLDSEAVDRVVAQVMRRGVGMIAVSLLFSFLNPSHEWRVRDRILKTAPKMRVLLSSDVNPEIKDYERGSTTVIAASLVPLVDGLLADLETRLHDLGVPAIPQVIKSNGGIMSAASARLKPLEIVRSGPAGGVASVVRLSRQLNLPNLIGIDIGGTTADVSVVTDGAVSYTKQADLKWDIPVRVSMADVRSVGAGGGSITWIDPAGKLHVGPRSAGSRPGPACYGRGGIEPTVTDAALVAGLIDPKRFLGGQMGVAMEAAHTALVRGVAAPLGLSVQEAASGIYKLVTSRMAQLINEMTIQVGLDPRDYALIGFGGAGPLFVAALVEEIGASHAIVPTYPAVWSAIGGLFADVVHDYAQSHFGEVEGLSLGAVNGIAEKLAAQAREDLMRDGYAPSDAAFEYEFDLRYAGQSHEITVRVDDAPPFTRATLLTSEARFEAHHEKAYAHRRPEDARELTAVRLRARVRRSLSVSGDELQASEKPVAPWRRSVWFYGGEGATDATVYDRVGLRAGFSIDGPAIIEEDQSNTVVPPGFVLRVGDQGHLIIARSGS